MKKVLLCVLGIIGVLWVGLASFLAGYFTAADKYVGASECVPIYKLMLRR